MGGDNLLFQTIGSCYNKKTRASLSTGKSHLKRAVPTATYQAGSSENRDKTTGPAPLTNNSLRKQGKREEGFPNPFFIKENRLRAEEEEIGL